MSNVTQFGREDGAGRLSEIGDGVGLQVVDAATLLLDLLARDDGSIDPSDESLLRLRNTDTRLHDMVELACRLSPPDASPDAWFELLSTSSTRPLPGVGEMPDTGQPVGRRMERKAGQVARREEELKRLEERAAVIRKELVDTRRMDARIIQIAVLRSMRKAMGKMFSMGPAWVIMRALSAHVSDDEILRDGLAGRPSRISVRRARRTRSWR